MDVHTANGHHNSSVPAHRSRTKEGSFPGPASPGRELHFPLQTVVLMLGTRARRPEAVPERIPTF